jgi:hypothetical protein
VKNLVGTSTVAAVATVVAEDMVKCDPIHGKHVKRVVALMGHQRGVASGASNLGILHVNVSPRRRWARPTWPMRRSQP